MKRLGWAIALAAAWLTPAAAQAPASAPAASTPAAVLPNAAPAAGFAQNANKPDAATASPTAVADIPVGGAASATLDGKPILLTQAKAGTVVGLSAICTHQGCTVGPHGGQLLCPCHGSIYGLDGSNVSGPAPSPLPPVAVHVVGGEVLAGAG